MVVLAAVVHAPLAVVLLSQDKATTAVHQGQPAMAVAVVAKVAQAAMAVALLAAQVVRHPPMIGQVQHFLSLVVVVAVVLVQVVLVAQTLAMVQLVLVVLARLTSAAVAVVREATPQVDLVDLVALLSARLRRHFLVSVSAPLALSQQEHLVHILGGITQHLELS